MADDEDKPADERMAIRWESVGILTLQCGSICVAQRYAPARRGGEAAEFRQRRCEAYRPLANR